jgi:orotidine-5'-phosphate decarboxylase
MSARILLALDTPDVATALAQARAAGDAVDGIKLGLEFFTANGPAGVARVQAAGRPLFLDLKFHDIPNTVAGAVRSALPLKPLLLNVHAAGGPEMLRRAAAAVREAGEARPLLIAVTVMTSLGDDDLVAVGQLPPALDQVRRLAALARQEGCDGVVCSAREIAQLRRDCGPGFKLVVPGLRPAEAAVGDQKRVMTPGEAAALGADFLVIGRPITAAPDPAEAARRIRREIDAAEGLPDAAGARQA